MNGARLIVALVLGMLFTAATEAQPQTAADKPKPIELTDALVTVAKSLAESNPGGAGSASESARASKQVSAPAVAKASGSVVDAPSFVQVIGLAVDNELVGFKNGAATVDVNLFAFRALIDPSVVVLQEKYAKYARLRRLGGSVSIGGKGEEFDQNGDGEKDKPKEAESLTDIVSAEIRWRFSGTRDRRDLQSMKAYTDAMKKFGDGIETAVRKLVTPLRSEIAAHDKTAAPGRRIMQPCDSANPAAGSCFFSDRMGPLTALAKDKLAPAFAELASAMEAYETAHKREVKAIDRQAVWTAVLNAKRQGPEFGPQRLGVGVRGVMSSGAWDHTVNVDWGRADWRADRPIAYSFKAGYAGSRLLSRDPDAERVPKITFAVNGERFKDVPDAKHNAILTAGLKLDIPFSESLSLPVSLNYASHTDLLTDQKRLVTAHLGLAWDFSALTKKKSD